MMAIFKGNYESRIFLLEMKLLAALGCLLIYCYSACFWASGQLLRILGVGILVAAAALLSGLLLGFIFAIPRIDGAEGKQWRPKTGPQNGARAGDSGPPHQAMPFNNNLVDISDWLTKIIVGVGLVELHSISRWLGRLSYYLAPALLPAPSAAGAESFISGQAAGLAILIFYLTMGFLFGYVWTTICFKPALLAQVEWERDMLQDYIRGPLNEYTQGPLKQYEHIVDPLVSVEASISANRFDEAMATIDKTLENDPRNGYAVMTKAWILKREAMQSGLLKPDRDKLLKEAIACIDQSIAWMPDQGEPLYNKACYQALLGGEGLKNQVLKNLKSAIRINPDLRHIAAGDDDFASIRDDVDFISLISQAPPPSA